MNYCLFILVLFTSCLLLPSLAQDSGECSSLNNCPPNALCKNATGTPTCACKNGFTGDDCEDINECQSASYPRCSLNAQCLNLLGSYSCSCNEGWTGDGFSCSDVDECALGTSDCSVNATCYNQIGTYSCLCKPGYYGNGRFCYDIDECKDSSSNNCSRLADCHNTAGGFYCECKDGYEGNGYSCSSQHVEEIVEAAAAPVDTKKIAGASMDVIIGCVIAAAVFLILAAIVTIALVARRRRRTRLDLGTVDVGVKKDAHQAPLADRPHDEAIISNTKINNTGSSQDSNSKKVAFNRKSVLDEEIYSDPESYSDDTDSETSDSGSEADPSEIETELSSSENKRVTKV